MEQVHRAEPEIKDSELYLNHAGTVLVSGKSEVGKVARYVVHLLKQKVPVIDVLFIGANAGQQAYKACAVSTIIARDELATEVTWATKRAKTKTEKRDVTGTVVLENSKPVLMVKDAFIWQAVCREKPVDGSKTSA